MKLSDRLKNYRKEQNLTQQDLANKLFVSRSAVAKWEQDRGYPDKTMLASLSKLLGIEKEELISNETIKNIALDSAQTISKNNKVTLFLCISLAILCAFSIFLGIYVFGQKTENKPIVTIETIKQEGYFEFDPNFQHGYIFSTYNYLTENKTQLYKNYPHLFSYKVPCYNVYGKPMLFSELRTGYLVMTFINKTTTKYNNKTTITYTADKIVVLDDYLDGDNYVKGFFISTETYDGEYPPIYAPESGYNKYKPNVLDSGFVYEAAVGNRVFFPEDRYPFLFAKGNTCVYSSNSPLSIVSAFSEEIKNQFTGYTCKIKREAEITLSPNVQKVYIYALDNSEKGYFLYSSSQVKRNTYIKIDIVNAEATSTANRHSEITINIIWPDIEDWVIIQEYDQNNVLIKTSCLIGKHEDDRTFKLEDDTAFVLTSKGSGEPELLQRGDKISLKVSTIYGYVVSAKYTLS